MKRIYIAGKISGECDTPELLKQCWKKFDDYGLKLLYPPLGEIIPYTISGFGYSSYDRDRVEFSGNKISYVHGFIINAQLIRSKGGSWQQYMKNDLKVMLDCDEVHFLKDWTQSRGAQLEHKIAFDLGMKIVYDKKPNSDRYY